MELANSVDFLLVLPYSGYLMPRGLKFLPIAASLSLTFLLTEQLQARIENIRFCLHLPSSLLRGRSPSLLPCMAFISLAYEQRLCGCGVSDLLKVQDSVLQKALRPMIQRPGVWPIDSDES